MCKACAAEQENLVMHLRNFSRENRLYDVHPPYPFICKSGESLHFQHPGILAVNHIAARTFRDKKATTTKPILSFLKSTLTWITEKVLEQGIENKADQFCWKENM